MKQEVFAYLEQYHMLDDAASVLVALSGGADSVCLLYLLKEYAKTHPVTVLAAHVHHGLRENADLDEVFVRDLCSRWEIPLFVKHIDAAALATEGGLSVEEAGRIARYAFFEEILAKEGADRIAVAHHRDDLCETMLFQMFRGSGIHGLHGILPVSGNRIRPLLCVGREEIEEFLKGEGISWREDESNLDTQYARNRIRHELLPAAEQICPGAKEHMAECAERVRMAEEFLNAEVSKAAGEVLGRETGSILIKEQILGLPLILQQEVVLKALTEIAGRKKDIGSVQVEAVLNLFTSQVGRRREFIYGIQAERTYEGVRLSMETAKKSAGEKEAGDKEAGNNVITEIRIEDIPTVGGLTVNFEGGQIRFSLCTDFDLQNLPKEADRRWFDADKIGEVLSVRQPVREDELIISPAGEHKSLYDYLKDSKVPAEERDRVWVLADGNSILWALGYRTGEGARVNERTAKVLEVEISGKA